MTDRKPPGTADLSRRLAARTSSQPAEGAGLRAETMAHTRSRLALKQPAEGDGDIPVAPEGKLRSYGVDCRARASHHAGVLAGR